MEATSLSARNSKGWGGSCTPADAPAGQQGRFGCDPPLRPTRALIFGEANALPMSHN